MKQQRRTKWTRTGIALACLVLAGCSSGSADDSAASGPASPPAEAETDAGSSEAAPEGGFSLVAGGSDVGIGSLMMPAFVEAAEEFGVDVEFRPMAQPVAQTSLVSGEVDLAFNSFVNLAQTREAGSETYAFAPAWASHIKIIAEADSGIESLEDIVGRPFGTYTRSLSAYTETYRVFADQGYDLEGDVEPLIADSSGLLEGMMAQGEIEAMAAYEPNATRLISAGQVHEVIGIADYWEQQRGVYTPVQNWTVRADWAAEHDMDLMRQIAERTQEIVTNDFGVYERNAEGVGLQDDPDGLQLLFERFAPLTMEGYTEEGLDAAQEDLDASAEFELIESEHDVRDLIWDQS